MEAKTDFMLEGKRLAVCCFASFIYAVGINLFVVPSNVYVGGLLGVCQLVRTLLIEGLHLNFNIDIASILYYLINIPLFIYARIKISKQFLIRSLITVTVMTVFMAVIPVRAVLPDDRLASCVIGGIICGVSVGLTLRMNSSAGGLDIIGLLIIMKREGASVGKVSLILNSTLYAACLFLFSLDVVIYSLIFTAVSSFAVDKSHTQNIIVEAKIITKKFEDMEKSIMNDLKRGVTKWTSVGSYTGEEGRVLCVLLSKYELPQLRHIVRQFDPNAFLIVNENVHVQGNFLRKMSD